jgi:hypothetical protein
MRTDLQTPVFPVHDAAMPRNRCFPLPPTIRPADVIVVFWPTSLPVRGIDATVNWGTSGLILAPTTHHRLLVSH